MFSRNRPRVSASRLFILRGAAKFFLFILAVLWLGSIPQIWQGATLDMQIKPFAYSVLLACGMLALWQMLRRSRNWPKDTLLFAPRERARVQLVCAVSIICLLLSLASFLQVMVTGKSRTILLAFIGDLPLNFFLLWCYWAARRYLRTCRFFGYSAATNKFILCEGKKPAVFINAQALRAIALDNLPLVWQITLCKADGETLPALLLAKEDSTSQQSAQAITALLQEKTKLPLLSRQYGQSTLFLPAGFQVKRFLLLVAIPALFFGALSTVSQYWLGYIDDKQEYHNAQKFLFLSVLAMIPYSWRYFRQITPLFYDAETETFFTLRQYDGFMRRFYAWLMLKDWQPCVARSALQHIALADTADGWQVSLCGAATTLVVYREQDKSARDATAQALAEALAIASGLPIVAQRV